MQQGSSHQPQTSRKQLPFTSTKPPFGGGGGGEYHHFAAADTNRPNQEFDEAIVVKTPPPLKRKGGVADSEVESAEQNAGAGSFAALKGQLQTPPSGKSGKAQKVPRTTKAKKAGSQIPMANIGSPGGNNLTPVGPCRYDSSLAGIDWNSLDTIPEDYTMTSISTPRAETPPPSTTPMPSVMPQAQTPPSTTEMPSVTNTTKS
ncbi:UNVERIFIED_CONTAM: Transcription factor E2FB [Sesamum calycinum]|uniref:Transcription factor E2FB n=1 Tax=Sesamum calycinum TaxID=2727403 RepID=A0AAW2SE20_9LAMI